MIVKRYTNDEIIKKIEDLKKDIEITTKIIDNRLIDIKKDNLKSVGRNIGYTIFTIAVISLTGFIITKDLIFSYIFFVSIVTLLIMMIYYYRLTKKLK
jgi:hypothetical protein